MKRFRVILIIMLFAANTHAQYYGFSVAGGIGTYQLNDLKLFQDEMIAIAPVQAKGLTYFPAFTQIRLEGLRKTMNGMKYGLSYSFSTTGAHANYSDNSGIMNIDQNISGHQLGIAIYIPLLSKKYLEILPYGRIMLGYTSNWVAREISIYQNFQNIGLRMNALSPAAELGLEALYHFHIYSFGIEAGYQYDVGGTMKIADINQEAADLILPPDRQVRSNISGLRIAAKIVMRFTQEPFNE